MNKTTEAITDSVTAGFGGLTADDGTFARIRDGQTCICGQFIGLSLPAIAKVVGIEFIMEGYASESTHNTRVGPWIYVTNDGGTTWSIPKIPKSGGWSNNEGLPLVEIVGGPEDLWGMAWTPASASVGLQVKFIWSTTDGDAVYLDYVKAKVYYAMPDDNIHLKKGTITLKKGLMIIN